MPVLHRILPLLHAVCAAALAVVLLAWAPPGASAHVRESTGYSSISRDGGEVHYALSLELAALARTVDLGDADLSAATPEGRAAALATREDDLAAYLSERLVVYADGVACPMTLAGTSSSARDDLAYADLDLVFSCAGGAASAWRVDYEVFRPDDAVVDDHSNIVEHTLLGTPERVVLGAGTTSFTAGQTSVLRTGWQFLVLGLEHILVGLDHVLFVIALALGVRGWKDLVTNVTTFTLAHSLTLGLAAVGWVAVPSGIVEPLIALSIAFVALDGLLGGSRHRLWAVFAFGLLHGLGFAGALRIDDGALGPTLWSLLSFNVGIEVGQLVVLAVALPVLVLLPRALPRIGVWVPRLTATCIAVLGLVWFTDRLHLPL